MFSIEQTLGQPLAIQMAIAGLAGYSLGCFSTGYYLVRWRAGQDIRKSGSRSTGARNVGRVLGKTGFYLTVLGDVAKGMLAVGLARFLFAGDLVALVALLAVVCGHLWPVQLQFAGGKGVATSLGALLILSPVSTLFYLTLFGIGYALSRKSVVSGLCAYALLPAAAFTFHRRGTEVAGLAALAALILFAHRQNLAEELPSLLRRGLPKNPIPPEQP